MNAIQISRPGGPEVLEFHQRPVPHPKEHQVLIAVEAAGVSRADIMQRQGMYPPPPGHSEVPGLEVAGTIRALGAGVSRWKIGDRVAALVNGGGYAGFAIAPEGQVLPVPANWTTVEAATLPENYFTVWDNVFERARLSEGQTLLVHGGTSGIGSTAIMLGKAFGCTVIATAGSPQKCAKTLELGADFAIDYRAADFVRQSREFTAGRGVDVVLDIVGGAYIARDIEALALDGRIACIATSGGNEVTFSMSALIGRRGTVLASSLRPRSDAQKAAIAASLLERVWPRLPQKTKVVPVIDSSFPLADAARAHERLESGAHTGKIILIP